VLHIVGLRTLSPTYADYCRSLLAGEHYMDTPSVRLQAGSYGPALITFAISRLSAASARLWAVTMAS
jgi:hypothetical protein